MSKFLGGGVDPRGFQKWGSRPRDPPSATPLGDTFSKLLCFHEFSTSAIGSMEFENSGQYLGSSIRSWL